MTRLLCGEPVAFESISTSPLRATEGLDRVRARHQQHASGHSLPLALAMRNHALQTEPAKRVASLVGLHEIVVRWLSAILLSEALELDTAGPIPELEPVMKQQDADWMAILKAAGRTLCGQAEPGLRFPALLELLFDKDGRAKAPTSSLQQFHSAWHRLGSPAASDGDNESFAGEWKPRIMTVCQQIDVALAGTEPIYVVAMQIDDGGDEAFVYQIRELVGDSSSLHRHTVTSRQRMQPSGIYLFDRANDRGLALDPLVISQSDPRTDEIDVLFLESAEEARLQYCSLHKNLTVRGESLSTASRRRRIAKLQKMVT